MITYEHVVLAYSDIDSKAHGEKWWRKTSTSHTPMNGLLKCCLSLRYLEHITSERTTRW